MDPLASVDQLQGAMGRTLNRDVALYALNRASSAVRGACGWVISREVVTGEVHNSSRYRRKLFLPTLHLVSIESVVEDGVTLTADTDYAFDRVGILYKVGGWWTTNIDGLVVSYTHGYQPEEMQMDIARTVTISAAMRLMGNPLGHQSEATGSESWVAAQNAIGVTLTKDERADLGPLMMEPM